MSDYKNWNYMQSYREGVFEAPYDSVCDAARWFMSQQLRWEVLNTATGFEAKGQYGLALWISAAVANFRIEPAAGRTKVAVELFVERRQGGGGMFDPFGHYHSLILEWMQSVQGLLLKGLPPEAGSCGLVVDGVPANGVEWQRRHGHTR